MSQRRRIHRTLNETFVLRPEKLSNLELPYHFGVTFNVIDSESDKIVALLVVRIKINNFRKYFTLYHIHKSHKIL